MLTQEHLDKVAAFHGHICPGMLIGFKAVEGAIAQLGLSDEALPAVDEEIVAVVENDACGVTSSDILPRAKAAIQIPVKHHASHNDAASPVIAG